MASLLSRYWACTCLLLLCVQQGLSFSLLPSHLAIRRLSSSLAAAAPRSPKEDSSPETPSDTEEEDEKAWQKLTRNLAKLSLEDYKWRSNVFKDQEAERMLEHSLARLRGEDPAYLRPMDASENSLGPLGRWEKSTVEWLAQVIEEEARRAEQIVNGDGKLIRPKDTGSDLGPLGFLEQKSSDFLQSIKLEENERVRTMKLRPMDVDESKRGPLGEAEYQAVRTFQEITDAEFLRLDQSRLRGGDMVRPIDVPGPLGELEARVGELFEAEKRRADERRNSANSTFVRPKDAKVKGPLGNAESQAYETLKQIEESETLRLQSMRRVMQDNRPMETNKGSILGLSETLLVGLVRAPILFYSVLSRVVELLASETIPEAENFKEEKKTKT